MKTSLFVLTAALLAGTAASARDVNHPFYLPAQGGFLSDTNVVYQNTEDGDSENLVLSEGITYGVTKNFALTGTISDAYYIDAPFTDGQDRWDNPAYEVGFKYNLIDCPKSRVKVQLGADYTQGVLSMLPFGWYLNDANGYDHHVKALSGFVKAGFEVTEGLLPYVTATAIKPIGKYESDFAVYVGRLGVYKTLGDNLSADVGVDYVWDGSTNARRSHHYREWDLDLSLNYKLSENTSIGVNGSYMVDAKPFDHWDYYTVGVNFKWAF